MSITVHYLFVLFKNNHFKIINFKWNHWNICKYHHLDHLLYTPRINQFCVLSATDNNNMKLLQQFLAKNKPGLSVKSLLNIFDYLWHFVIKYSIAALSQMLQCWKMFQLIIIKYNYNKSEITRWTTYWSPEYDCKNILYESSSNHPIINFFWITFVKTLFLESASG